jgi:hypothetical protein
MSKILESWKEDNTFLDEYTIDRLIHVLGDGKGLLDSGTTGQELRQVLQYTSCDKIDTYLETCINSKGSKDFEAQKGFVLQEIVNAIGAKLDFKVTFGNYRGNKTSEVPAFDGIWETSDSHSILIESKSSTDRINIDQVKHYRDKLFKTNSRSSALIVYGRNDDAKVEQLIRGSESSSAIRCISAKKLCELAKLKQTLFDEKVISKIQNVLRPVDYLNLDLLVDTVFDLATSSELSNLSDDSSCQQRPAMFHRQCMAKTEKKLATLLNSKTTSLYSSSDESVKVVCCVSKKYERDRLYWFAFRPQHVEFLSSGRQAFVCLGCGSADTTFLIPHKEFTKQLLVMRTTVSESGNKHWHIDIFQDGKRFFLTALSGERAFDITKFLLP